MKDLMSSIDRGVTDYIQLQLSYLTNEGIISYQYN